MSNTEKTTEILSAALSKQFLESAAPHRVNAVSEFQQALDLELRQLHGHVEGKTLPDRHFVVLELENITPLGVHGFVQQLHVWMQHELVTGVKVHTDIPGLTLQMMRQSL